MPLVVVGMSGGVDSSVAALLLKEQGYEVIGVTMQIWQDEKDEVSSENGGCCGLEAVDDAKRVASYLGIPHYTMNFKKEFKHNVIDYFVEEYLNGRTPNPCIACNRHVKWESLLDKSLTLGADFIATGHYARIVTSDEGRLTLKVAKGAEKDQTYVLYDLTQEQLERTLMPVGDYSKEEIRDIAARHGLPVAHKPDSQDICFVTGDYGDFIEEYTGNKTVPGNFVDMNGNIIGRHKGIIHYTKGQRRGLGVAAGNRIYVQDIRPETNEVVLGENKDLFTDRMTVKNINFMSVSTLKDEMKVTAKIRYNHKGSPARIRLTGDNTVECTFEEPVRAVTSGQAGVFYSNDCIICGGVII